jgi:hypothetical protein
VPIGADLPLSRELIFNVFVPPFFSIFAQGLTMPLLLRRWGLTEAADAGH